MIGRRVGIWHPGMSSNHGDRAIQQATIDLVFARWPDARIVQFHSNVDEGVDFYDDPRVSFEELGPLGMPPLGRRLSELDVLLWGGGSLIQQSSLFYFPWQLLPAISAARQGVTVVCFGSGVEPMRSRILQRLARMSFDSVFDEAFVRGPLSSEYLTRYGVERTVPYAVDQAASLVAGDRSGASRAISAYFGGAPDEPTVSVNVKPSFLYRAGLLPVSVELPSPARSERRRRRTRFEDSFAELVQHIVDNVGARVLMVPMFIGQGDTEACRRVARLADRGSRIAVMDSPPPPRQLKAVLREMSAHVGVRLHSCILATSAGTPTLAVEYMAKHRDYFAMLEMEDSLITENDVTGARLIRGFDDLWLARDKVREELVGKVNARVRELGFLVDGLFARLDEKVI